MKTVGTKAVLEVRVGTTELDAWKLAAARDGMKLSEWVREMLDRAIKQEPEPAPPQKLVSSRATVGFCVPTQQPAVNDWDTAYERIRAAQKKAKAQS